MIDLLYRTGYRCAYQLMRVYWATLKPATHGALVALWHQGRVLLVKNSYVNYHSLPGGYVQSGETGQQAAARELFEETKLRIPESALKPALDEHHTWEHKREHIQIFELEVDSPPSIQVDNREVIQARFFEPAEALQLKLFPPLRRMLIAQQSGPKSRGTA